MKCPLYFQNATQVVLLLPAQACATTCEECTNQTRTGYESLDSAVRTSQGRAEDVPEDSNLAVVCPRRGGQLHHIIERRDRQQRSDN